LGYASTSSPRVGVILVTSLGIGGFPPATAVAITLTGATVILMMMLEGWP
jgi:hypothetical protein